LSEVQDTAQYSLPVRSNTARNQELLATFLHVEIGNETGPDLDQRCPRGKEKWPGPSAWNTPSLEPDDVFVHVITPA
jgi:hypothetical protein